MKKLYGWTALTICLFIQPALAQTHPDDFCTFDGDHYGYLYKSPSWDAAKITDFPSFPCYAKGNGITEFYDQKKVFGPKLATIEVIRDVDIFGYRFKKGDTFQSTGDTGEGDCDMVFKKDQPEDTQSTSDPQTRDIFGCPWLLGFANHHEETFRIKSPTGPQHWYHLVDRAGNPMGWYLTHQSEFDPILKPLPNN